MSAVFFTDRDLGKRFPDILASAGLTVRRHHDLFPHDCSDETWIQHVGEQGWVAITHDGRIRYKPNELRAVRRHRAALLVVVGKVPFPLLAQNFVATIPKIMAFLSNHQAPFIAKVHRPPASELTRMPAALGSVSLWYPR